MNSHRLISSTSLARLEEALFAAAMDDKADDPIAPVVVMVGSGVLGRSLSRKLARRVTGLINMRFVTIWRMAESLGAAGMGPKLPGIVERALLDRALDGLPLEYFDRARRFRGFLSALLATLRDLRDARLAEPLVEALERGRLKTASPKMRDLAAIAGAYYGLYQGAFHDDAGLLEAAAKSAKEFIPRFGAKRLHLFGLYDFTRAQGRMIEALAKVVPLHVYIPYGDSEFFSYAKRGRSWYLSLPDITEVVLDEEAHNGKEVLSGLPPKDVEIVSAPGEPAEAEEIAAKIVALAEAGAQFGEMGVVVHNMELYLPLIREAFDRAGVPYHLAGAEPWTDAPGAKTITALLNLITGRGDTPFFRPDLIGLFMSGELKTSGQGGEWTPDRWRDFSIRAEVVSGREDWDKKLAALAESSESSEEKEQILRFREVALEIIDRIDFIPESGPMSTYAAILDSLLRDLLDPEVFARIEDGVASLRKDLAVLDQLGVHGDRARFRDTARRWIEDGLASGAKTGPGFGQGAVTIGPVMPLRGVRFSTLFFPGMQGRSFPSTGGEDPILLDGERGWLEGFLDARDALPIKSSRPVEDRLLFALFIQAAEERLTLSYSRVDPETGRERLPSPFLIQLASAIKGESLDYASFLAAGEMVRRAPHDRLNAARPGPPLDIEQLALQSYARSGRAPDAMLRAFRPFLPRALRAIGERRKAASGSYLGLLGKSARPWLAEHVRDSCFSPSGLESYAKCPFHYLCGRIMKLKRPELPEDKAVGPMERGSFVHELLSAFMERARDGRMLPLGDRERGALLDLMAEVQAELGRAWQDRGKAGGVEWKLAEQYFAYQRPALLDSLIKLEKEGFRPAAFEMKFGFGKESGTSDPLLIDCGGPGPVKLRGIIDRVDQRAGGVKAVRAIDYKTGSMPFKKEEELRSGTALQGAIYLLAAAELAELAVDELAESESGYAYVLGGSAGRSKIQGGADFIERARRAIGAIVDGMGQGIFCPLPAGVVDRMCGGDGYCDYKALCGAGARTLQERLGEDDPAKVLRMKLDEHK